MRHTCFFIIVKQYGRPLVGMLNSSIAKIGSLGLISVNLICSKAYTYLYHFHFMFSWFLNEFYAYLFLPFALMGI